MKERFEELARKIIEGGIPPRGIQGSYDGDFFRIIPTEIGMTVYPSGKDILAQEAYEAAVEADVGPARREYLLRQPARYIIGAGPDGEVLPSKTVRGGSESAECGPEDFGALTRILEAAESADGKTPEEGEEPTEIMAGCGGYLEVIDLSSPDDPGHRYAVWVPKQGRPNFGWLLAPEALGGPVRAAVMTCGSGHLLGDEKEVRIAVRDRDLYQSLRDGGIGDYRAVPVLIPDRRIPALDGYEDELSLMLREIMAAREAVIEEGEIFEGMDGETAEALEDYLYSPFFAGLMADAAMKHPLYRSIPSRELAEQSALSLCSLIAERAAREGFPF